MPAERRAKSVTLDLGTDTVVLGAKDVDDSPASKKYLTSADTDSELSGEGRRDAAGMVGASLRAQRLKKSLASEISPYQPKYEQRKKRLEAQLQELKQGKRVEFDGEDVWENTYRWYRSPERERKDPKRAVEGWRPLHAKPGTIIENSQKLHLERIKSPVDKRRVESSSLRAKENVKVASERTSEIMLTPFRNLVFFEPGSKNRALTPAQRSSTPGMGRPGSRGASRNGGERSYYPPMDPDNPHPQYAVPKSLLSPEERAALGVDATLGSSHSPGRSTTPGGGKKKALPPRTPASIVDSSTRTGSAMRFALPPMHDRRLPTPDAYCGPSKLKHRGNAKKCNPENCDACGEVAHALTEFEETERKKEEEKRQRAEEAKQKAEELAMAGIANQNSDPNSPISDAAALKVVKAVDKLRTNAQRERQRAVRHDGVTIAQLYQDMTHRDREDVYISVVGGLSFDLTREKFSLLMQHVLAPRIGVFLSDEQIHTMFSIFDINHGGTISYFEYLASLCHTLLTEEQTGFLQGIFNMLIQDRNQQVQQRELHRRNTAGLRELAQAAQFRNTEGSSRSGASSPSPSVGGLTRKQSMLRRGTMGADLNASMSGNYGDDDYDLASPPRGAKPAPVKKNVASGGIPPNQPMIGRDGKIQTLNKRQFTFEKVRRVVFGYRGHSLSFPHPMEDRFSHLLSECFDDLRDADEVDAQKFKLLVFCDDQIMEAVQEMFPTPVFSLPGEESDGDGAGTSQPVSRKPSSLKETLAKKPSSLSNKKRADTPPTKPAR